MALRCSQRAPCLLAGDGGPGVRYYWIAVRACDTMGLRSGRAILLNCSVAAGRLATPEWGRGVARATGGALGRGGMAGGGRGAREALAARRCGRGARSAPRHHGRGVAVQLQASAGREHKRTCAGVRQAERVAQLAARPAAPDAVQLRPQRRGGLQTGGDTKAQSTPVGAKGAPFPRAHTLWPRRCACKCSRITRALPQAPQDGPRSRPAAPESTAAPCAAAAGAASTPPAAGGGHRFPREPRRRHGVPLSLNEGGAGGEGRPGARY